MNILLFAGTTEARLLVDRLRRLPLRATICTATEYGAELLAGKSADARLTLRAGRMNAEEMTTLMREENPALVIDATHPYAAAAGANIRAAAEAAAVPLLRLARAGSATAGTGDTDGTRFFDTAESAAAALAATTGNVLLATGAKELDAFTTVPGFAERLYPRVLPTEESIRACAALGFPRSHVIAMQGPFSRDLNRALMQQFAIKILVTKDGGAEGGFAEKLQAAEDVNARAFILRRPGTPAEATGMTFDEIITVISKKLQQECAQ